jgi:hypothetical protein
LNYNFFISEVFCIILYIIIEKAQINNKKDFFGLLK